MESKTIYGVVRHYWIAKHIAAERTQPDNWYRKNNTHYHPYMGDLKAPTDLEDQDNPVKRFLETLPDGEAVEITIKPLGKSPCATGFVWAWTKANTYERIPESDFEKMVQLEISGNFKKNADKYDAELSDVLEQENK
jgi:hypothetical protein